MEQQHEKLENLPIKRGYLHTQGRGGTRAEKRKLISSSKEFYILTANTPQPPSLSTTTTPSPSSPPPTAAVATFSPSLSTPSHPPSIHNQPLELTKTQNQKQRKERRRRRSSPSTVCLAPLPRRHRAASTPP